MRISLRTGLAAIVAVLAMSALVAASASAALPEFSAHERVTFSVSGTTQGIFKMINGEAFDYKSVSGSGTITGPSEVKLTLTFQETPGLFTECVEKKATTVSLSGKLGYINKATKEVGLLLEAPTGPVLKCKAVRLGAIGEMEFLGSWIGHVEPVNTKVSSLTLNYLASGSTQKPEKFEGELLTSHHLAERFGTVSNSNMAQEGALTLESFRVGEEVITETVLG